MRAKIFACNTLEDEVKKILPSDMELDVLPYALHRTPKKLNRELQLRIDQDEEHDTLLFAYGLCSQGVVNLHSKHHTLVIPKVHDCISLLLGARQIYDREFAHCPGSYYLSKGWIDQGADPLAEYLRYEQAYGQQDARWMIDTQYGNYQRVVFIDTGVGDPGTLKAYAGKVAESIEAGFHEMTGSLRLLRKLLQGEWDQEFVVVPPGRIVLQRSFL